MLIDDSDEGEQEKFQKKKKSQCMLAWARVVVFMLQH